MLICLSAYLVVRVVLSMNFELSRHRLFEPWCVPLLLGKFPPAPHDASSAQDLASYALFAMMLLCSWRELRSAIVDWIGGPDAIAKVADRNGELL